jgi:type II secretory pathway component HofQ
MVDWNRLAELFVANTAPTLLALAAVFRSLRRNQKRIEDKADGQHTRALEEIKKAGKYEGVQEAKQDSRLDREQIVKAVEQVLAAQSKLRGRRRSDG